MEMAFMCKKCKKAFRKDMSNYEESDEYCPHCDNHYVSYLAGLVMIWLSTISDPTRDAGSAAVLLALLSRPPDTNLPIHRLSTQRHRNQPLASRVMMPVLIPGTSAPRRRPRPARLRRSNALNNLTHPAQPSRRSNAPSPYHQ